MAPAPRKWHSSRSSSSCAATWTSNRCGSATASRRWCGAEHEHQHPGSERSAGDARFPQQGGRARYYPLTAPSPDQGSYVAATLTETGSVDLARYLSTGEAGVIVSV